MPIRVQSENEISIEYHIPDDILVKIPDDFYREFLFQLYEIFHMNILDMIDGTYNLHYLEGTSGWANALKITCELCDMTWLWDYWNQLEWYDSDLFDGELGDLIISKIVKQNT